MSRDLKIALNQKYFKFFHKPLWEFYKDVLLTCIQFTSLVFIQLLKAYGIHISMDGNGYWRDNVVVDRLWRTIKYEEVYLRAYASVSKARVSLGRYLDLYNALQPCSRLDHMTTDSVYFKERLQLNAA